MMKKRIKILILFLFFTNAKILFSQNVVGFTLEEGFTNGSLYSQSGWDSNYQSSTWMVNADIGVVSTNSNWKRAAWGQEFSISQPGDYLTFRIDLNFTGTFNAQNNPLIKIGFSPTSDIGVSSPTSNTVFLSTTMDNEDNPGGSLQLRNNTNTAPLSLETSLPIEDCQGTENTTDNLAVIVTLTLGDNAESTTISGKLLNTTDGTTSESAFYQGVAESVYNAALSNIYPYFHAQSFTTDTSISSINVSKVSMTTNIDIFPFVRRSIGGVSELNREKFFNIHSSIGDTEGSFYQDYNVSQSGRQFWAPGSAAIQSTVWGTGEVGVYPEPLSGDTEIREVRRYIATDHTYNVYEEDLDPIPFADWTVEYFKNYVDTFQRPEYYEPMNEPFVKARFYYDEPDWDPVAEASVKLEMAQFFKHIAEKIHAAPELVNMKVIGYSAAFLSFEKNNFNIWNDNMKMFMDEAGEEMDALSYHIYDGINQIGQNSIRSGSNMDAIIDMIETYSNLKWGVIKPHAITEFGGITNEESYSDIDNVQSIRSQNSMLFGLFERTDRLEIAIPFTTGKSTWHINEENNYLPYKAVLYKPIPIGVPIEQVTTWEFTDRIYFYDLWKHVSGQRVLIKSDNPDIQVQGFLNDNILNIAINNLDDFEQFINLNFNGDLPNIDNIKIKSLIIHPNDSPDYNIDTINDNIDTYRLQENETAIIEITFDESILFENSINLQRYYSHVFLQDIVENISTNYSFNQVNYENNGFASLSMSIGREHDLSKSPTVIFNGTTIQVPTNWKGYDQLERDNFFGTIEIPVPYNLIQENNSISISFDDSGGYLSSVVLNLESFDESSMGTNDLNFQANKLIVYPNPSSGIINFKNVDKGSLIEIFSITGKKVFQKNILNNSIELNLPNGLYFLKTNGTTFKLIIDN